MFEQNSERRKSQRIDAKLELAVKLPVADGRLETAKLETLNISSSGIYFKSDHFIEPMTKLEMELELPGSAPAAEGESHSGLVTCQGIVVRVMPEEASAAHDQYEIAVFFTDVSPEGLHNLEEYIAQIIAAV